MRCSPIVAASCACALVVVVSGGCGGPPKARSAGNGERLPANGVASSVQTSQLPSKTIGREDWNKAVGEKLKPTCDAREGVRTADASNLEGAGKIIGAWSELSGTKGKSRTGEGKELGAGPEPTRVVRTVGLRCAAGASMVQVNGVQYPFDVAWVVSGKGHAKTLNGTEGAGEFAMIQALSYRDQRVVFAKVYVPSDANDDTDDTVIVSSLAGLLPANPDEPIVRAVSDREDPKLETFLYSKGTSEGLALQVPQEDPLGRARYLSVGRFVIGQ